MIRFTKIFLLTLVCLWTIEVQAETVVREGTAITIDETETIEGDYYVSVGLFSNTTMSGTVLGDMYAFGLGVTTNGPVEADLSAAGGVVQVHAPVTDDVRALAGEVVIADDVGGDVFVMGGILRILSTAQVTGNIFFSGGQLIIDGTVNGSVFGSAQQYSQVGTVNGSVDVEVVRSPQLQEEAVVDGDFIYQSPFTLARAPGVAIGGEVIQEPLTATDGISIRTLLLTQLAVTLFAALVLYLFGRRLLESMVETTQNTYSKAAVIGLALAITLPIISAILLVSGLSILLGLISLAVTIILYILSLILAGILVGSIVVQTFAKRRPLTLVTVVIGVTTTVVVSFVPFIGPAFLLVIWVITLGGVAQVLFNRLRN